MPGIWEMLALKKEAQKKPGQPAKERGKMVLAQGGLPSPAPIDPEEAAIFARALKRSR